MQFENIILSFQKEAAIILSPERKIQEKMYIKRKTIEALDKMENLTVGGIQQL